MSQEEEPRLQDYLEHILEAIRRIEQYSSGLNETAFLEKSLVQDAVIRNFEIIGEASRNIDRRYPDYRIRHPEVPWLSVYEMRNAVAHGSFRLDLKMVWRMIGIDLPNLKSTVDRLLNAVTHCDPT